MYTIERLLRVSSGRETAHSTIDRPLEHLVACHRRIEERLDVLERAGAHLEDRPEEARQAIASAFRYFESSGVAHNEDEERSVFPRLRPRVTPQEEADIRALERDHQHAYALYTELKSVAAQLNRGVTPELCAAWREAVARFAALYRSHIAFEDRELIAVARRELSEAELAEISQEMKERRGFLRQHA